MKTFECGTLVPGCAWKITLTSQADVVQHAVDHLKSTHGEKIIRPSMVTAIKDRITEADADAA
ncbi:MAG: DUF1059 domain-containing protein [Salaquimonas sp.]